MESKKREIVLKHLAEYKNKNLTTKQGTYKFKKKDYVLPKKEEKMNLIGSFFKEKEIKLYHEIKIHSLFNHLNSSQALTINFTAPLIEMKTLGLLIGNDKSDIKDFKLEKKLIKSETFEIFPRSRTSFDLFIQTKDKNHFYEFKYLEKDFGIGDKKDNHKKIFKNIYKPKLEILCEKCIEEEKFLKEYQLWRNICHVIYKKDEISEVYFALPEFRKDLIDKVEEAKKLLKDVYKEHVHIIKIDEIVDKFKDSEDSNLKEHYTKFYEKYLNINL